MLTFRDNLLCTSFRRGKGKLIFFWLVGSGIFFRGRPNFGCTPPPKNMTIFHTYKKTSILQLRGSIFCNLWEPPALAMLPGRECQSRAWRQSQAENVGTSLAAEPFSRSGSRVPTPPSPPPPPYLTLPPPPPLLLFLHYLSLRLQSVQESETAQ